MFVVWYFVGINMNDFVGFVIVFGRDYCVEVIIFGIIGKVIGVIGE